MVNESLFGLRMAVEVAAAVVVVAVGLVYLMRELAVFVGLLYLRICSARRSMWPD